MDEFNYLAVLLSIILGLAVTEILTGFRGLLQARERVQLYWPSLVWSFLLLVIYAQTWWSMFGLRTYRDWKLAGFGVVLLQMILLYMLAGLVLPEMNTGAPVDLRRNYFAQRKWFFGLTFSVVIVSIAKDLVLSGAWPTRANLIFHGVFAVMSLVAWLTVRERIHKVFCLGLVALFSSYIVLLFAHLR